MTNTQNREAWPTSDGRIELSLPINPDADFRLIMTVGQAEQCAADLIRAVIDQTEYPTGQSQ